VAVLESKPNIRKLVMMTLGGKKFKYFEADNADEGISMVLKELPDFVICSQDLSGRSGMEICRAIKKVHGLAQIPFLLLFGDRKPDDKQMAEAGVNGAVPKKLLTRFLRDEVKRVLSQPAASPSTDHVALDTGNEVDEPLDDAVSNPSGSSSSRPSLYKQKAAAKQSSELLSDSYKAPPEESDVMSVPVQQAPASYGYEASSDPHSYEDLGIGVSYDDPVSEFLKDSVVVTGGGTGHQAPARPVVQQQAPSPRAERPKPVRAKRRRGTSATGAKSVGSSSLSEDDIHEAVREACVDALREIIPDLKRRLVASLEEKLRERK